MLLRDDKYQLALLELHAVPGRMVLTFGACCSSCSLELKASRRAEYHSAVAARPCRVSIPGLPQISRRGERRVRRPSPDGRNRRPGRRSAWPCRGGSAGRSWTPGSASAAASRWFAPACPRPRPSASPNSTWVHPPGRPSSGSMVSSDGASGSAKRQQQPGQVVDMDQRQPALGRHADQAAAAILNRSSVSLSPGP